MQVVNLALLMKVTLSFTFFQLSFAFIIPEILRALKKPALDLKNIWPLDYSFFWNENFSELLQNGKLGWRVSHRDQEAVAVACIEMLKGKDKRCDRNFLREQTLARFSFESLCQSLEEIFQADDSD